MYAYVAFFLVLLTYGMETSYFRYASKSKNPEEVYSTSIISLFFTSFSFVLLATVFQHEIAALIHYPDHPEYIWWFALILSIDAFTAVITSYSIHYTKLYDSMSYQRNEFYLCLKN